MTKIKARLKSDKGDSELVTLLILLPLVMMILFTIIDTSILFSNRSIVQSSVRDAARTVAIMGGNGTVLQGTPIEVQYGETISAACAGLDSNPVTSEAYDGSQTVIECHALQTYAINPSLINVKITDLACTPTVSLNLGATTSCTVNWEYNSIPGGMMKFIKFGNENVSVGTSETEVDFSGGNVAVTPGDILQPRPVTSVIP